MSSVLFLQQTHTLWGGVESWVDDLGASLQKRNWRVQMALAKGARYCDPEPYRRLHPTIPSLIMDASVGTESARVRAIVKAVEKTNPEIVILLTIGAGYAAMRQLKAAGHSARLVVPVLSHFTDTLANILDNADIIDAAVANSRLLHRFLQSYCGARAHYVLHGVKPPARHDRAPPATRLRAGFVGRLEQSSKRVFDLAALRLDDDVELHIWGDGPERAALQQALPRAVFHGFASKQRLYAEAYPSLDVLLLFSESEGSPTVVWEAMHHGVVPVVSRFVGAGAEGVLKSGVNSMLFDVGDVVCAGTHLRRLQRDRELLARLSAEARHAMNSWTDIRMHEGWADVFAKVLAQPPLLPDDFSTATPAAGRLDRVFPSLADRLRAIAGRRFPHRDGFGEWPGSAPVRPERVAAISAEIRELNRKTS